MAHSIRPYFVPTIAEVDADRSQIQSGAVRGFDSSRSLAGMLLAAVVAALLVVADQLIDTWADGHLLVVWVSLWTVAFAALALLTPPLRQLADVAAAALAHWSRMRSLRSNDEAIWRVAQQDHRVLRELQMASLRSEHEA